MTADDWLFWLPNIPPPDSGVVLDGGEKCQEDPSSINPEAPGSANPSEVSSAMVHDDEKEGNVRHVKECDGKKMPASFVEQSVSGVVVRRARPFPNRLLLLLLLLLNDDDDDDDDVVDSDVDTDFDVSRMLISVMIFTVLLSASTGHLIMTLIPFLGAGFRPPASNGRKAKLVCWCQRWLAHRASQGFQRCLAHISPASNDSSRGGLRQRLPHSVSDCQVTRRDD